MSKTVSVRTFMSRMVALAAFMGSACLIGLAAQPPKEVEDPKAKVVKKVIVEDEGTNTRRVNLDNDPLMVKKTPESFSNVPPDVRLDELVRASDQAQGKALKEIIAKYIVPFDHINESGGAYNVKPIPYRRSEWGKAEVVGIVPLDQNGKPKEQHTAKVSDIKKVEHFETLILEEAERLQKQKLEGSAIVDQLATAEVLLSAALRFHDYSRTPRLVDGFPRNLRRGKNWEELHDGLVAKLRTVRLEFLKALVASNEQARLRDLINRLMVSYPKDAEMAQVIATVQVAEAERLLKSGTDQGAISARIVLDELQTAFPGAGGENASKLRAQIHELAVKALNRSKEKKAVGDEKTARDELARAESIEPELDGIREMKKELRLDYPILYVGVRQMPRNMSPATARLDSEKQAVELVFEGLMEEVPDPSGAVRYRTGAALTNPTPFPGGREFSLRVLDKDANGRPIFDSHDVVGTVNLMRAVDEVKYSWSAYPLTWLAQEPPAPKDNATVRISFGFAHPDPRSAFTFKILPARWLIENGKRVDDVFLAEKPFGTGPFMVQSNPKEVWFVNNPAYGRWRDRSGLPSLREIRFVEVPKTDPVRAFQEGKLHILPDIATSEIDSYTNAASGLRGKVDVVTASINRRVHILAVNLKRPSLQSKQLRQGLSLAIDREDVLRKVYRAGKPDVHRAMTGPFPPGSWSVAKGPGGPEPLTNRDLAVKRFKDYLADQGAQKEFELAYAEDDPKAYQACDEIKKQIESLLKNDATVPVKITITPKAYPMSKLLENVQDQHSSYDLAYVPFDYPDDWYPYALGAALDPVASGFRGRNWFNFTRETCPDANDQELSRALGQIRFFRDFSGQIAPQTFTIGKLFNDSLPFIPLWQLDRHMVVSKRVKIFVDDTMEMVHPRLLNQSILFQGVARWRVE
jgi:peptide/nickel transport system substrate-binding protein